MPSLELAGQSNSLKCCENLSVRQALPEAATLPVTVFHMHQVQVIPSEKASTEEGKQPGLQCSRRWKTFCSFSNLHQFSITLSVRNNEVKYEVPGSSFQALIFVVLFPCYISEPWMLSILLQAQYMYSAINFPLSLHSDNLYTLLVFSYMLFFSTWDFSISPLKRGRKGCLFSTIQCRIKTFSCILRGIHLSWISAGWKGHLRVLKGLYLKIQVLS